MKKSRNGGIVLIAVLGLILMVFMLYPQNKAQTMAYSEVIELFENGEVAEFSYDLNNGVLQMVVEGKKEKVVYKLGVATLLINKIDEYRAIRDEKMPDKPMVIHFVPATETPIWLTMLPMFMLILLVLGGFYYFMYAQAGGGKAMNVGKAKVKNQADDGRKATFKDVAGADEEKEELEEIVQFLKNQSRFNTLGARIPHGVLLVGPPGTGKTLLARACAGEAGVPFYSISGSDFVEMYVGVGASRVRDLFDKAKKSAPCIIFIDEIDAVGRQRGAGLGGGHDEREQTLNQLLVEMDGFGANEGVIVVAATNRADILDKALLRPGRFDRQVYVGLPDSKGREEILKVHTRNKPLAPDVNLKTIAKTTVGFTGADLENLVNEAALLAAKRNRKAIVERDIEEASVKVVAGPEKKSRVVTLKEKKLTAYHEAGHAIAHDICKTADPVHQISIIPRGMAGGFTMSLPEEDTNYRTKKGMEENIVTLLGGRVAEKLVLDDISTGASSDLERATAIARAMVTRYGFSERLGPVVYGSDPGETFLGRDFNNSRNYSETIASEIDAEIREMLDEAFEVARNILLKHMDELHRVAAALLEREKLSGEEFKMLMNNEELPPMEEEEVFNPQIDDKAVVAKADSEQAQPSIVAVIEQVATAENAADATQATAQEAEQAAEKEIAKEIEHDVTQEASKALEQDATQEITREITQELEQAATQVPAVNASTEDEKKDKTEK